MSVVYGLHPFPGGRKILVALCDEGLCWLGLDCGVSALRRAFPAAEPVEDRKRTAVAAREIARLWPGNFGALSVPLALYGTRFELGVWKELLKIRPGGTLTYAELARKTGAPKAFRSVGSAVGRNPVSIVVPCHRVISGDGRTVHYAWGADVKIALLRGEGVVV